MIRYIIRRALQSLVVLFIVTVCAFLLMRLAPGNPTILLLPDEASEEQVKALESSLGFDQPLYKQFWNYFRGLLRLDFGKSIIYRQPVIEIISTRIPNTVKLAVASIIVGCLMAIPLGIVAGSRRGSAVDLFCMLFAFLGQSMSGMWLGVLLIFIFSVNLGWLPAMGIGGIEHMILPVLTLGYPMAAALTRVARSGIVDTLSEDYITASYAKGISSFQIYTKYALRNAMIPVVTMLGLTLGSQLAGAVVTETVFGWPGMGQLLTQSVATRDYPVVQSLLLISAFAIAVVNFVVDIINSIIDPRLSLD